MFTDQTALSSLDVTFERSDTIRFVLDDDPSLDWLRTCDLSAYQRIFIYIDATVQRIWGTALTAAFASHGQAVFWMPLEASESTKSLDFYPTALAFLETNGASRYDLVVGIGGGIVLDLVSFLTSTYMRGLPFYAIPTTLVGQMDASTAGKTCLNTPSAKNVLGTFYYPRVVYNNICFLSTNTPFFLRQGYSEVYKYGLLRSPELIAILEAHRADNAPEHLREVVRRSIDTRVLIRKQDSLASNLGHTFGHAIEKLSNYNILHGDAISAGTVMALHYARRRGLARDGAPERIVEQMKRFNLNVFFQAGTSADDMVRLMLRDKKSSADALHLVLIRDAGEPYFEAGSFFYRAEPNDVRQFLAEYLATSPFAHPDCAAFLRRDHLYDTAPVA